MRIDKDEAERVAHTQNAPEPQSLKHHCLTVLIRETPPAKPDNDVAYTVSEIRQSEHFNSDEWNPESVNDAMTGCRYNNFVVGWKVSGQVGMCYELSGRGVNFLEKWGTYPPMYLHRNAGRRDWSDD